MAADIRVMVKEVREQLRTTQEGIAEKLTISPKYYQQIESGWASPSLSLALDIVEYGGAVEIERGGSRFVLQALRPDMEGVYLNRIDRSACTIMMKLAEELAEGAAAINKDLLAHINRFSEQGESTEELAVMYEQCIADTRTAISVADEWFRSHRPDVAELGADKHRRKVWERGYAQVSGQKGNRLMEAGGSQKG